MLKLFENDSDFIIIGYSFGSMLALKIASLLEVSGKTGKVVIIDGSPKFIHQISNKLVPQDSTDDDLQELILMGCTKLLFRDSAQEIGRKIFSNPTAETRFEAFLQHAKERSEYSIEYGRHMLQGLFNRFKISLNADKISFTKLKNSSRLAFVKPSESSLHDIDDDYGLSDFIESEIDIKVIDGDHASILNNDELIQFITSNI